MDTLMTMRRFLRVMHLLRLVRPRDQPVTYDGNLVTLLRNGPDFFHTLFEAIRTAEHFILAEYYIIQDDDTGDAFADELIRAASRGVCVKLIYDYLGSVETASSFFGRMAKNGVELVPFNPPSFTRGLSWFDRRDHRKMTIIDGRQAFLGGLNIGDEYAGQVDPQERFYDVGFILAGKAAHELIRIFSTTWQMERDETLRLPPMDDVHGQTDGAGRANVTIVASGVVHHPSHIHNTFRVSVVTASREILLVTPYFVPGPRLLRELMRAARRGVKVRILLPARSDLPIVQLLGRSFYGALLREGIEIRELECEILHAKVLLTDGNLVVTGSANLDQRSFHRNFEINLVIRDPVFGGLIRDKLLKDLDGSRLVTLANHERRGMLTRILERIVNLFGWFL